MKKENIMNGQFNRGFTLMELLVTMAVAAILLAVAVPSFQTFFNRNRVAAVTNDYITAINYARSEAVKGGAVTTICMSSSGSACTGNTNWSQGWIIWADRNANSTLDAGELVRTHGPINAGNVAIGGTQTSFSFNGQGALTTTTGGDAFNICTPSDLTLSNRITIDPSGHLRRVANPGLATCP
ncbi:MAG TPA: GspH/FimT family pseudopilin [Sulfuriferula sp.]|nr:GspH/FimT family pseudopilin [Sulfuriferula sp.]